MKLKLGPPLNPLRENFSRPEKLDELLTQMQTIRNVFRRKHLSRAIAERRLGIVMAIAEEYGWKEP
jgi:hypothetical protein